MSPAEGLALASAGLFLLVGLAAGVWKYSRTMSGADHRAPVCVEIALIAGEIGGVLVLVWGFLEAEIF